MEFRLSPAQVPTPLRRASTHVRQHEQAPLFGVRQPSEALSLKHAMHPSYEKKGVASQQLAQWFTSKAIGEQLQNDMLSGFHYSFSTSATGGNTAIIGALMKYSDNRLNRLNRGEVEDLQAQLETLLNHLEVPANERPRVNFLEEAVLFSLLAPDTVVNGLWETGDPKFSLVEVSPGARNGKPTWHLAVVPRRKVNGNASGTGLWGVSEITYFLQQPKTLRERMQSGLSAFINVFKER